MARGWGGEGVGGGAFARGGWGVVCPAGWEVVAGHQHRGGGTRPLSPCKGAAFHPHRLDMECGSLVLWGAVVAGVVALLLLVAATAAPAAASALLVAGAQRMPACSEALASVHVRSAPPPPARFTLAPASPAALQADRPHPPTLPVLPRPTCDGLAGRPWTHLWLRPPPKQLHAWWAPPTRAGAACTLFFHGNGGCLMHHQEWAAAAGGGGRGLLAVDYSGYGASAGRAGTRALLADANVVAAAVAAAAGQPQWQHRPTLQGSTEPLPAPGPAQGTRWLVVGWSMGCVPAVRAAAAMAAAGLPLAGVVLVVPFLELRRAAEHCVPAVAATGVGRLLAGQFSMVPALRRLPPATPLLVVAAKKDEVCPPQDAAGVLRAAPQAAGRLLWSQDPEHNGDHWDGRVEAWAAKTCAVPPTTSPPTSPSA